MSRITQTSSKLGKTIGSTLEASGINKLRILENSEVEKWRRSRLESFLKETQQNRQAKEVMNKLESS